MPSIIREEVPSKKRKRVIAEDGEQNAAQRQRKVKSVVAKQTAAQVAELEAGIVESQKNLNNIATLISLAKKDVKNDVAQSQAIIALCRVFCRLLVDGRLTRSNASSENELTVIEWLRARYGDYQRVLLDRVENGDATVQVLSTQLCMQLLQEEVSNAASGVENIWKSGFFLKIVSAILTTSSSTLVCEEFVDKFVKPYDDVRHYSFLAVTHLLKSLDHESPVFERLQSNVLTMFTTIEAIESTTTKLTNTLCTPAAKTKPLQVTAHRKAAQAAILALLSSPLSSIHRKTILTQMTHSIVPWFTNNVELLMDFLTDSYNAGGSTSLLSLSGLFYLMQEKNLDYPEFYPKLYSLLDANLLHSKHRSRFFRLMNTFMSSTHLPAAMVASFIKRLSRLALDAPPAGIVAVVPWVYNMLRSHPTCTFMIHRAIRTEAERQQIEAEGATDPFNMNEADPMESKAIDSCLWELVTLQSHYHPNVASLAGIISEQFTKREYNLDDFLDHSYASLIEAELGKDLKKAPVVEFEIPKKIFTSKDGDDTLEKLMQSVLAAA